MSTPSVEQLDSLWAHHNAEWRDSAQIASQWREAKQVNPKLLNYKTTGDWWDVIEGCDVTLLVTREYEHLVMALSVFEGRHVISFMPLPHPSGLAVDEEDNLVHVASTRNPNQIYDFAPVMDAIPRLDAKAEIPAGNPLVPVRSSFYPGSLYLHDLAFIDGDLHGNAVGHNAVVRLDGRGKYDRVWWPRCIESDKGPVFGQNHLQLNSIAAGPDLDGSYFSASTDRISSRRPGHKNFPVDGHGVVFSGTTREPIAFGLTRPHSARLFEGDVWLANSGYGELGIIRSGRFERVVGLPGWTRGLCFVNNIAFVATSRVIPRFRQYAPGLDVDHSICGIHAVDVTSHMVLGSLIWPYGNQVFAIEAIPRNLTLGFPFLASARRSTEREKILFYAFEVNLR